MTGRLVFCATPIGHLGDVSERLRTTLLEVDVVFAEDTRRTGKLLSSLAVATPMVSFFTGNESQRLDQLRERLTRGESVAIVTDAGMPTVSDPGSGAVAVARDTGAVVDVIPGPSAVTSALAISGFGGDRFVFEGFLPRKQSERDHALEGLDGERRTIVIFAAPHRLGRDLADLVSVLQPTRMICVARELTKLHQELWWGTLGEALTHWDEARARGEFTLVIAGATEAAPDTTTAAEEVERLIGKGASPSRAVKEVAGRTGVSRRELYELVVRRRAGDDSRHTPHDP